MREPYLGTDAAQVTARAKQLVAEHFRGAGKDRDAATRLLQKRVEDRHDPLSLAIRAELDRRK